MRRTVILVPALALLVGVIAVFATMTPKTTDSLRGSTPAGQRETQTRRPDPDTTRASRADIEGIVDTLRQRQAEQDPSAADAAIKQANRLIEATDAALSKLPPGPTEQGAPSGYIAPKPQQDLESRIAALRKQLDGVQR
jgi:hypothetical protein